MQKILIVEDEFLVAENIAAILEQEDYAVCGIAGSAEEALQLVHAEKPALIICDIFIRGSKNGIELASEFSKLDLPFIYLTALADQKTISQASLTKPLAYLVKPFTEKQLLAAVSMAIVTHYGNLSASRLEAPTKREIEILNLLAKGNTSKQIAFTLSVSEHTVQTHRRNLMNKYNAYSSSELIALAARHKWIQF